MRFNENAKKFWRFLKEDTWQSWLVSLVLMILFIKLIFFPLLSLATGSAMPLLVVESCSMYHAQEFSNWWSSHKAWYESKGTSLQEFESFHFKNGLNKGDIILVTKVKNPEKGRIIIFRPNEDSVAQHPIIHRIISENPIATKGDNNVAQLTKTNNPLKVDETSIPSEKIIGKATIRIPYLGWIKLIFFEPFRPKNERGLCTQT